MHEFAIARAMIEAAETAVREHGATGPIRLLRCKVGVLRQIDDDLMQAAFEAARFDSRCADATLELEHVPVSMVCSDCTQGYTASALDDPCPQCGGEALRFHGGDELDLISIEVDEEEESGDDHPGGAQGS